MSGQILTEVSAVVDEERVPALRAGFEELLRHPTPDGLLRTELLRGRAGHWRIQSLWRDQDALDAMRAGAEPPAAPALFRQVGADPTLTVHDVLVSHSSAAS